MQAQEFNMHHSPTRIQRHLALGFTLIEVMIVVVIVAILASVAYPAYQDYVIRGRIPEATSALSTAQNRMEQYFQDNRSYQNAGGACGIGDPADTANFVIDCTTGSTTTFTVTARGAGSMNGFVYTIDQDGARKTTGFPSSAWGTGTVNCWVTKKGGTC
ncbi:MAG: type IV pilin protein [Aquabacterium sp.]